MNPKTLQVIVSVALVAAFLLLDAPHNSARVPSAPASTSQFRQVRGTSGYWRLAEDAHGRWWFVSPDGKLEFLNLVAGVRPFDDTTTGTAFRSREWDGGTDVMSLDRWSKRAAERVLAAGFKGVGAWSHPAMHQQNLPITRDLNLWRWAGAGSMIYSAEWRTEVKKAIELQVRPLRTNRNLVGYYLDNELDWSEGSVDARRHFDGLPRSDPNRLEVIAVIRSLWSSPAAFNAAWGTEFASMQELEVLEALPEAAAYEVLNSAWLEHLARDYFRFTTEVVRANDPNHLILGVRYKGWAPAAVVKGSARFTDAQSINRYTASAKLDYALFEMLHRESGGQPVIVSEFSFHSLDGRSGNRNKFGFVAQVADQAARARGYELFTTRMARVPYVVGCEWFQWFDEPPEGRADGEDVNFGVVDIFDVQYDLLVDAVRRTTPTLNGVHANSVGTSRDDDAWERLK